MQIQKACNRVFLKTKIPFHLKNQGFSDFSTVSAGTNKNITLFLSFYTFFHSFARERKSCLSEKENSEKFCTRASHRCAPKNKRCGKKFRILNAECRVEKTRTAYRRDRRPRLSGETARTPFRSHHKQRGHTSPVILI